VKKQKASRECLWGYAAGLMAFLWVVLRSGTNPRRLAYPCQRAAVPLALTWLAAVAAFLGSSLLLRRLVKLSAPLVVTAGVVWLIVTATEYGSSETRTPAALPAWEVSAPMSTVFVMDSIPATSGSLAAGDASVPDEHLDDPAIDTMLAMLETKNVFLYRTAAHPDGVVGADNVVIIKGNYQWSSRNTTSTDRIKGLIRRILDHPGGFTGEILVCDNTQDIGAIDHHDNNSEDSSQSILDVVGTFAAKGYPVYWLDWNSIWDDVAVEYDLGDYSDGYVFEEATKVSYPKFRSPSDNYFVSLRYGLWDSSAAAYDAARLCVIDFPVLKAHGMSGATVAVKNWIGVLTTAYSTERYGGFDSMHYSYFFGEYALPARVMAATYPRLTIVDAAWITTDGPDNLDWVQRADMLAASTDPVAVSWYTAKYMLTPIARDPSSTNPDQSSGGTYRDNLESWAEFLADSAGYACTKDSSRISVYDRSVLAAGDVIRPTVAVTSPASGTVYTTPPILDIDFSDNSGLDRGYYQLDSCTGPWTEFWSYNSEAADTSISWLVPSVSEGTHKVYFKATDDAGNSNGDTCTHTWTFVFGDYICGDVNGGGLLPVDIADLIFLIDYMFRGGPEPPVPEAANVDGVGGPLIDISDLIYLIDFMFNAGSEPVCQ